MAVFKFKFTERLVSPPNFHSMSTSWLTIRVCATASLDRAAKCSPHYKI